MDLKKFKLISALLLAGALLFLSVIMVYTKKQADNLPFSAAEDLSALFAKQGVELPPDIIPLKRERLPVYSCSAADGAEAQKIAETVIGSKRLAANLTEDGYLFRLENGAMIEISLSRQVKFNNSGINTGLALKSPPSDAAQMMAEAFISRFDSEPNEDDEILCTYALRGYSSAANGTLLYFDISIEGIRIEDGNLSLLQSQNGDILSAYGKCVFSPLETESGFKYYDIINVLKKEYDGIAESGAPSDSIVSIEQCYLMRSSADKEKILFLPGWKIEYSNGDMRFYESVRTEQSGF